MLKQSLAESLAGNPQVAMVKEKSERGSASIRHSKVNMLVSQSSSAGSAMGGRLSDDAPIVSPINSNKSGGES